MYFSRKWAQTANSETYDKALLTLSSVLLGGTLTFTQNVVPLDKAFNLSFLIASWVLFAATIVVVILSFIYSLHSSKHLKAGARLYYLEDDDSANDLSECISDKVRFFNLLSGILFILAIVLFTFFVGTNVYKGNVMSKDNNQLDKSQPVSTFNEQQLNPIPKPEPVQSPKPQQDGKK